ncbi:MAG: PIN domain-containing protein [SAR202 cluster bacterium]|nr:PIN domain-containing protein [SAR202 cluster bacterium]
MYVVDTSVWVSKFVIEDSNHSISAGWFEFAVRQGEALVCPSFVLAETAGAVARRTRRRSIGIDAARLMEQLPIFRLVSVDLQLAKLSAEVASRGLIRGSDAVYVALAQELDVPLVTWDQEQKMRGNQFVRTTTPMENSV